jgi:hypothetical protein
MLTCALSTEKKYYGDEVCRGQSKLCRILGNNKKDLISNKNAKNRVLIQTLQSRCRADSNVTLNPDITVIVLFPLDIDTLFSYILILHCDQAT